MYARWQHYQDEQKIRHDLLAPSLINVSARHSYNTQALPLWYGSRLMNRLYGLPSTCYFSWHLVDTDKGAALVIIDQDQSGCHSVTNDIDNVLHYLLAQETCLPDQNRSALIF